jgi:hypothetical protein
LAGRSLVTRLRTDGGPSHELLVLLDQHRVLTSGQLAWLTGAAARTVTYLYRSKTRFGLRSLRIFADQSAKDLPATDPRRGKIDDGWPGVHGVGWSLITALVGPVLVVVFDELL